MEMHNRRIMQKFLKFLVAHVKFDVSCTAAEEEAIIIDWNFHSQNYQREFEEINEQLLRLETLGLIDMHECDLQWQKFVNHANLISYCFKFFETVSLTMDRLSSIPSNLVFSISGHFQSLFDIASTCVEHFATSEGHHGAQNNERDTSADVAIRYNSVDATLLADRDESVSASAANAGRVDHKEDHVLPIAERLAGNRFGVREQYVPNIRGSRLFVSVSVFLPSSFITNV